MEEAKRRSAKPLLALLAVAAVAIVIGMVAMGKRALHMNPEAFERNRLMKKRTLSCAEPYDEKRCRKATAALIEFDASRKRATK